jgi:hypothetical protein
MSAEMLPGCCSYWERAIIVVMAKVLSAMLLSAGVCSLWDSLVPDPVLYECCSEFMCRGIVTFTESLFSGLSRSEFPCLRTSSEDDRFEFGSRRLPNMTLYLSSLMSGMLTSSMGLAPGKVGTFCALLDTASFGTAGTSFATSLEDSGFVADRTTDTRGLAGRLPAVKARALVRGGSGAIRGLIKVRDARMLGLKVGGEGVRPISRPLAGCSVGLAGCCVGLVGSSSWWLSARIVLVAVIVVVSW